MSLDGLRAWIGEVERKLGARTRVFLVLAAIAVGGSAAGIYLAVEAKDSNVSESDVQALETRLQEQIGQMAAAESTTDASPDATQLEARIKALEARVTTLEGSTGSSGGAGSSSGDDSGGSTAKPNDDEAASPKGRPNGDEPLSIGE